MSIEDNVEIPLSPRQCELLTLMAVEGLTVKGAAEKMYIGESTARLTLHNIRCRLGAKTTANAVWLGRQYINGNRP